VFEHFSGWEVRLHIQKEADIPDILLEVIIHTAYTKPNMRREIAW